MQNTRKICRRKKNVIEALLELTMADPSAFAYRDIKTKNRTAMRTCVAYEIELL